MNLRRYLAILREQQRRLEALARSQGSVPLRRNYDAVIASITKVAGSGKVDAAGQREILARTRQAMTTFIRVGSGVLDSAAAHVVTATAGQAFNVVAALEKDRTGRSLVVSDRGRDAIASAGPKPSTLIGAHERSLARYGAHVVLRVQEQIGTGIAIGETHTEILDRVMRTADMEWYQADRIVRTELSYAGNSAARAAIGEENKILGDVFSQWTENADEDGRPLDEIVCVDSLALHGQIASLGQSFIMPPTSVYPDARGRTEVPEKMIGKTWDHPPNRPNDRSVIGPWRPHWATPGWRWEDGRRIDKRRPLEDASRDIGEVSDKEKAAARRVQERSATALAATQGQGTRELGGRAPTPRPRPAVPGAAPRPAAPAPAPVPEPAPVPAPAQAPQPPPQPAQQPPPVQAKPPENQPPAKDEGAAKPAIPSNHQKVRESMASGRYDDGRVEIQKDLEQDGMVFRAERGEFMTNDMSAFGINGMYSASDGSITIDDGTMARAKEFLADPKIDNADGFKTVVHETVHGAGPRGPDERTSERNMRGAGGLIEEVFTETAAREYVASRYGFRVDGDKYTGAYIEDVDLMTEAVSKVFKVDRSAATGILEKAARAYKSSKDVVSTPEAVIELAASKFPEEGRAGMLDFLRAYHEKGSM